MRQTASHPQSATDLQSESHLQTDRTQPALDVKERQIGWIALRIILIALVIGLIAAAIVFRTWTFFFIVLLVVVPYALLLTAPTWLARMSQRPAESNRH